MDIFLVVTTLQGDLGIGNRECLKWSESCCCLCHIGLWSVGRVCVCGLWSQIDLYEDAECDGRHNLSTIVNHSLLELNQFVMIIVL